MIRPSRFTEEMIDRYLGEGVWTEDTMVSLLHQRAATTPSHTAVSDSRRSVTWSGLFDEAHAVASGVRRLGIAPGECIVVQIANRVENVVLRHALKMVGLLGVYVPMTWRERELRVVLETTRSRLLFVPSSFQGIDFVAMVETLRQSVPSLKALFVDTDDWSALVEGRRRADNGGITFRDVSLVCVSSGSTGRPKLCESPEASQIANGRGMAERLGVDSEDVVGIGAPLDGGAGLMGWLIAVASGARVVLADDFRPESMLDGIARERVTVLATVPALLIRLVETDLEKWDLSSLEIVRTGSAALSPRTAREAERRLGATLVPAAGTMEVLTYAQTSPSDPAELRLGGSVGKPISGNEARVLGESGTLEVRGAGTGSGYYGDLEATRAAWSELGPNGWFRTGDLASIDEAGHIFLRGRTRDVVSRGGRNIFPVELESILMEHDGIQEVAVVGVPCPSLGEKTRACVVARRPSSLSEAELRDFLETKRLATYKMPDEFRFLDELPRLAGAKIDRNALREG